MQRDSSSAYNNIILNMNCISGIPSMYHHYPLPITPQEIKQERLHR